MAEMNPSGNQQQKTTGVKKGKKLSTRVDLTPMVDLGFLLITFFIFTTTMSQATAMKLSMPKDTPDSTLVTASSALTFVLAGNNTIYYYSGVPAEDASNIYSTSFTGMRNVIIENRKRMADPHSLVVIIKPEKESVYKNTVDALDEMTINDVTRYAMAGISPMELKLIEIAEHKRGTYKSKQAQ